ncbi:VOC family protein [Paenibacillus oceani]|uniref:VOC family protein n=1 Tax=Paenibacillus oceani TaxID=2772510 RepID=A0A927CD12_9BACL|nr:VOC family protein [Paenibacillus oceani]MBD2865380.1 VOC family protein [Paenibacillus oceani]
MEKITPFLMFQGNAEEAMNYYTSIIEDSAITSISRYGANQAGEEGSVFQATFTLKGREYMCIDSHVKHGFNFTPSFSLFITAVTEEEIDRLFKQLSEGGSVLMPLGDYSFSRKFGWVVDKFGVAWQINLP